MKTAESWLNELSEATSMDMFVPKNPPGCRTEAMIRAIQLDAFKAGIQRAAALTTHHAIILRTANGSPDQMMNLVYELLADHDNLTELP